MSAFFTNTPVKTVPSAPFCTCGTVTQGFLGPIFFNGARWGAGSVFYRFGNINYPHAPPSIVKSVDSGVTWTQSIGPNDLNANTISMESVYTSDGTVHFLAYQGPAQGNTRLAYVAYNLTGETWGTAITTGPSADDCFHLAKKLDGSIIVVYTLTTVLRYSIISGAAWGSAVTIDTAAAGFVVKLANLLIDAAGTTHILYTTHNNTGTRRLLYVSVSDLGVISTPVQIDTWVAADGEPLQIGLGTIWNDRILWSYVTSTAPSDVLLYEGTPVAAPVFTRKVVTTLPTQVAPSNDTHHAQVLIVGAGVKIYYMNNPVALSDTVRQIESCSYDGTTFGAPQLVWDTISNPAVGDPIIGALIDGFSLAVIDDGVHAERVEMIADEIVDSDFNQTLVFLAPSEDTPFVPLDEDITLFKREWVDDPDNQFPWGAIAGVVDVSCNNPCDPVLGVPYNHAFTADGVAPYVYSIISGALPTGLTLDSTTGIASGLPSAADTFSFVVQVIDSFLAVDAVSCSITVTDHVCPWQLCDLFTTSAACAMDGTIGLRRTADGVTGSSDAVSSTPITVVAGQVYFVEFFLKGSGGADGTISVGYDFYDVDNIYLSSAYVTSAGSPTVFTSFTGTVTVPANAVTAIAVIVANDHLTGIWCIAALFSVLMDNYFILSSIRSYFTDYSMYR